VGDVILTGLSLLPGVVVFSDFVCLLEEGRVGLGVVETNYANKFV
jgi:hypothetical protein